MTSIRLAPSTSLTSLIERSWPTASGVSVSGEGDGLAQRQHRQRVGQRRVARIASSASSGDSTTSRTGLPSMATPVPIGTRRVVSDGSRSGSSIRSTPSS